MKMTVGFVGWRGMVGSVLLQRMQQEGDFEHIEPVFFSTSNVGGESPRFSNDLLKDAYDLDVLAQMDAVVSCQGGDYTNAVFDALRQKGWNGFWIDAASTLRMCDDACIVLDPINKTHIIDLLERGNKNFVGGNCTVSLLLMAMGSLIQRGMVEWISAMTYQAASGAGAGPMRELLMQMGQIHGFAEPILTANGGDILSLESQLNEWMKTDAFETSCFTTPLAGSLIPYIDTPVAGGQS